MFSIKSSKSDQIHIIRDLASKIWKETYKEILSKEQLDYMFDMMYSEESLKRQIVDEGQLFFIAEADGVPVGYISIEPREEHVFVFQKVYTVSEMHGKGLGRFMIEKAIEYLKSIYHSPFNIELFVNRENPAVGFYKHLGFKEIATRDHHIGNGYYMNDYIMQISV
jgi:Acetyltransferases